MATAYVRYKAPDGTISAWQILATDNIVDKAPRCDYDLASGCLLINVGTHRLVIHNDALVECQLVADPETTTV